MLTNNDIFEKLRQHYEQLAIQHNEAIDKGDRRAANRTYHRLQKLFDSVRQNSDIVRKLMSSVLKSQDVRVRVWAAAHCLSLKINIEEAEKTLAEVSNNNKYKLLSFTAEKTLEVWKEQGYLKL
jgi:hypothetical protein